MISLPYTWLDVFAGAPLGGNQLAAFAVPADLPEEVMRRITRELNHSETTFLQPPTEAGADLRVRIFIPTGAGAQEIPFAGHPLLGSAVAAALGREGQAGALRLQTGAGIIPVTVVGLGEGRWEARMSQPLPRLVATLPATPDLAMALGLTPADIMPGAPVEAVDNGMQTVLIPLASMDAVRRAVPDMARLRALLGRDGLCTMLFALGGLDPASHVHCRVFSPFDLVAEDPATGSANGPLGEYLVRHGLVAGSTIRSEQGEEMGRPSQLTVEVTRTAGTTRAVYVSGQVWLVGRGEFRL